MNSSSGTGHPASSLPSHLPLRPRSGSAPCYLHSKNRLYLAAAAKYRPTSVEYSWLGKWSWGWERHWGGSRSGAEGKGRKNMAFPGKLRDPRTRTPLIPSLILPGAHFLASWELTVPALPGSMAPRLPLPPDPLQWGRPFLRTWGSSSLSWSLTLHLPTPATSQTQSRSALPLFLCFVSSSPISCPSNADQL